MSSITVSAPGKLMLLGEHAVVYGHPCLVTAVDQRMRVTVEMNQENELVLNAPDVQIHNYRRPMDAIGVGEIVKGALFVETAVKNFIAKYPIPQGVTITTSSDFSSLFGFGSSSASTVCVVKALAELVGKNIPTKELFNIAYKSVLDVQKKGSGFDVAAAIYGKTLYFVTGGKKIEPLSLSSLPLIVGYTGVKADTVSIMKEMSEKMNAQPERVNRIYEAITKLVEDAKIKMIEGDWERVGKLMDFNQEYLRDLGVSSEKLESLIVAAKQAGAWGAKLSGAGGGDCMIAVAPDEKKKDIESAIESAGGKVIHIHPHADGTRRDA